MLETLLPLVWEKSLEIILTLLLKKFWKWVLSNNNLKSTNLKNQIVLLYLHFCLLKTPVKENLEFRMKNLELLPHRCRQSLRCRVSRSLK